jgi:wobble nucleotide-excising tRNase
MTTHEQRIANLERFQSDAIQAVQESNMYIGRHEGIMRSQEQDIKAMRVDIAGMRTDMHSIAATLQEHTNILKAILDRLPPAPAKE